ncbi:MAG: hypothetical protein IPJ23_05905 [Ignavibacteriales bacterium]|nr:hypothetical protein [Ignavibacteriales bacterium]
MTGRNNDRNEVNGKHNDVEWEFVHFNRFQLLFGWINIKSILNKNYVYNTPNVLMLYDGIGLTNVLAAIIGRKLGYSIFTDIVEGL